MRRSPLRRSLHLLNCSPAWGGGLSQTWSTSRQLPVRAGPLRDVDAAIAHVNRAGSR
jgi:hypothetical protein